MKHTIGYVIIFLFSVQHLCAQKNEIAGEYSLSGVREIASGLQLHEDSTFQFYFSYGALDRYGSGIWSIHNDGIILNSKPYPGKDFKMAGTAALKNNYTTIKIEDPNTNLYRLVYCLLKRPAGDTMINAGTNGIMVVQDAIDSIHLISELCPERITSFPINFQKFNSYTFHFEQWITEVFFKSFPLRYAGDHLLGKHPLLDNREYKFNRVK